MNACLLSLVLCNCLGQLAPATPAPSDATTKEDLEIRYARAQLELAQANLKRVQQTNQKLTRAIPSSVVSEYEQDAAIAKTQLERAERGEPKREFAVWLRRAETEWKTAETQWQKASAVNKRAPGTFESLDIERFRLRVEVARLQYQRGKLLAGESRDAQLQWEVDMLNNEVQRLREETTRNAPFSRFYPVWW